MSKDYVTKTDSVYRVVNTRVSLNSLNYLFRRPPRSTQ